MKKLDIIDEIVFSEKDIKNGIKNISNQIYTHYSEIKVEEVDVFMILQGASIFSADLFDILNINGEEVHFNIHSIKAQSYYGGVESTIDVLLDFCDVVPEQDIKNKNILIIDDIYDTGNTLFSVIEKFKKYNPKSLECCVLLNRKVEKDKEIDVKFIAIETDRKEFFIGYGLDLDGKHRDLPYIATFNKE